MSKVKLRKRPSSIGREMLYLDIYPGIPHPNTGKLIRRHSLKIYIYSSPTNELERVHNKQTMELGYHVCANVQLEVQNKRFGFLPDSKRDGNFIDFFEELSVGKDSVWLSAVKHFKAFMGEFISFRKISEDVCSEFRDYLSSGPTLPGRNRPININAAASYFGRFRTALKIAYKKKMLTEDIAALTNSLTARETHREYLTQEEFQLLSNTPCKSNLVKIASLFSVLTGLRFSDVAALCWSHIKGERGNYYIQFHQEKTDGAEVLPISDIAIDLLGNRQMKEEHLFPGLRYSMVTFYLPQWVESAGIEKHITFHCFRHTFAILQLIAGTDIYTISKLLGHRSLKTTLIYLKSIDKLKQAAVKKIKLNIDGLELAMA